MFKTLHKILFTFCLTLLVTNAVKAQTIIGEIKDKQTNESLIGASVNILNSNDTSLSSMLSLLDGSFQFKNLKPGDYTIHVSYLGYQAANVVVNANATKSVKIALTANNSTTLADVTVLGHQNSGSENTARNMERNAEQVMNIVSAKAIELSPDLTVANVIQRVSGVSIERSANGDGQYALIRGMDKRYNYTTVNGIKIPSPDNKSRYVPLDVFPAELLDRLEVYKALTPDMEGDAIGGVVNMKMKDAPDYRILNVNISCGYSQLFIDRPYLTFNNKAVSKSSPYESNGKSYSAKATDFSSGLVDYHTKNFTPNLNGGLAYGNRFLNKKLGLILAGSFQNSYRGSNSILFGSDVYADERTSRVTSLNYREYSEEQSRYGLHSKFDYQLNKKTKFQWYNAYLNLSSIQTRENFGGLLDEPDASTGVKSSNLTTRSRFNKQQIFNSTLQSDQVITDQLSLQWSAVYSIATSQTPDNTSISISTNAQNVTFADSEGGMTRRWEHNQDRDLAGYLNFNYKKIIAAKEVEFRFGGLYRDKQRSNFYNNYRLDPTNNSTANFDDYTTIQWSVFNPTGSVATALTYHASENIGAAYGMSKFSFSDLQVVAGVRAEHTNQGYDMDFPNGELRPKGSQVYTDILPSLNLKYVHWKNKNLRASYYKSISRPSFFEIVPYKIVEEDYQERGNPDLKHAVAHNFDLRLEIFPNKSDQILIGTFYKSINNPIEYTLQKDATRGQNIYLSPGNFGNARNYGFEVDFIKYFKKFGVKGNYTFTDSKITTSKFIRERDANGDLVPATNVSQTRPLYGQSAHVANLVLLYKDAKGWDGQIGTSYTGDRINTVSQFLDNDLWQKGFLQLDFSIEKKFKNGLALFAKANNLLNTPAEVYIKNTNPVSEGVPYQDLSSGKTLISRDKYQSIYLIGIRIKI